MATPAGARESSREDPSEGMPTVKQWVGTEDMRGGQGQSLTQREKVLVVLQHHIAIQLLARAPGGPTPLG